MAELTDTDAHDEVPTDAVGPDRRAFIRRMAVAGAFATPVVASFSMSGVMAGPIADQASNVSR